MNALVAKIREATEVNEEPEAKVRSIQQINALADLFSPRKVENKGLMYVDTTIKGQPATTKPWHPIAWRRLNSRSCGND